MMRKPLVLVCCTLLLGGCAIPVPLQIASWALDGISMLATQKSVTDHGISIFAQQDCAVWRGVMEGELCREAEPTDALVAEDAVKSPTAVGLKQTTALRPRALNANAMSTRAARPNLTTPVLSDRQPLQVRAVPSHALRAAWAEKENTVKARQLVTETTTQAHALRSVAPKSPASKPETTIVDMKAKPVQVASLSMEPPVATKEKLRAVEKKPAKGIYFVIGSFRDPANAARLVDRHAQLSPSVLSARLDGSKVYRVVVGPVPRGREKRLHRALARDGFPDTWAIRVDPDNWRFAKLAKSHSKTSVQLAALQK